MYQNIFMLQNMFKTKHKKRNYFTKEEDASLTQLVNQYGTNDFGIIAKRMPNRNARQCRDRWQNYLNPNVNNNKATKEEDKIIIEKFREIGPKWEKIAKFLGDNSGRTNNWVKNRFYEHLKNNPQIQVQNQAQPQNQVLANQNQQMQQTAQNIAAAIGGVSGINPGQNINNASSTNNNTPPSQQQGNQQNTSFDSPFEYSNNLFDDSDSFDFNIFDNDNNGSFLGDFDDFNLFDNKDNGPSIL